MKQVSLHWGTRVPENLIGNGYGYRTHNEDLRAAVEKIATLDDKAEDALIITSPEFYQRIHGKRNWLFTMFEETTIPEKFQKTISQADILIAPTVWAANVLRAHFPQPVHVIPHGVDPSFTYALRRLPVDKPIRFLWVGAPNPRKGWEEITSVWQSSPFSKSDRCELYLKTTRVGKLEKRGNVILDGRNLDRSDLIALYHSAHCFVLPTRGEGFGLCVGPETLIQTPKGVEPICELNKGDLVLTDSGFYSTVEAKVSREADRILEMKIKGRPQVRVTPEHPFLAYTFPIEKAPVKQLVGKSLRAALYRNSKCSLVLNWTKAGDLQVGDLVAIPRVKDSQSLPLFIDLVESSTNVLFDEKFIWKKMGFSPKIKQLVKGFRKIPITNEILEFFGWYIAEGNSMGGKGVEFSLSSDEDHIADWLIEVGKRNFGLDFIKKKKECSECISVWTSSSILGQYFSETFGHGAYNKKIPTFLMNTPSALGPLVKGFLLGDGHAWKDQGGYVTTTASVNLAWQLNSILTQYGIFSRITYLPNNGGVSSSAWVLSIGGAAAERLADWSGLNNRSKGKRKPHRDHILLDDYILVPIQSISEGGNGKVFDIQVKGTHSFVGNGVVLHNTLAEAMATGLPCIATGYSGVTQFFDDRVGFPISYKMGKGLVSFVGDDTKAIVDMAYPNPLDLYEKMHLVLGDYKSALLKGKRASERIKSTYTWEKSAQKLISLIQEYGG